MMWQLERPASGAEPDRAQDGTISEYVVSKDQKTCAGFLTMQLRTLASDDLIVLDQLCGHSDSCFQGKVCSLVTVLFSAGFTCDLYIVPLRRNALGVMKAESNSMNLARAWQD